MGPQKSVLRVRVPKSGRRKVLLAYTSPEHSVPGALVIYLHVPETLCFPNIPCAPLLRNSDKKADLCEEPHS
jgi:hypothetical protein